MTNTPNPQQPAPLSAELWSKEKILESLQRAELSAAVELPVADYKKLLFTALQVWDCFCDLNASATETEEFGKNIVSMIANHESNYVKTLDKMISQRDALLRAQAIDEGLEKAAFELEHLAIYYPFGHFMKTNILDIPKRFASLIRALKTTGEPK